MIFKDLKLVLNNEFFKDLVRTGPTKCFHLHRAKQTTKVHVSRAGLEPIFVFDGVSTTQLLSLKKLLISSIKFYTPFVRGAQFFQKSRIHLKILGAIRMVRNKVHTENPQLSRPTVKNLVATTTWRRGIVHPCLV